MNDSFLREYLSKIDNKGYKFYKNIKGKYAFPLYNLYLDHIQGDPFASPSYVRISVPMERTFFPKEFLQNKERKIALSDFLGRKIREGIGKFGKGVRGTGKSGLIWIEAGGQEIMERTSVLITEEKIETRFRIGLPAHARRIDSRIAIELFFNEIPKIMNYALVYDKNDYEKIKKFLELFEDANFIRKELSDRSLVAFVGDGAILPRKSGISSLPLEREKAILFKTPPELEVKFFLPSGKIIKGMGIPIGITLIVGGGFHGKSTLLRAIEMGVYNHIPGDGREYVITDENAVKIRSEDGRNVEKVDISPFIDNLPYGKLSKEFTTNFSSGSTSQATNIMEALEMGAKVFLVDEDTSATNFMIRDNRMQALVSKDKEPITPFLDKVKSLYKDHGVSTILVLGGSGDYFDVSDKVLMMDSYYIHDVTEDAKNISSLYSMERNNEGGDKFGAIINRIPLKQSFNFLANSKLKLDAKGIDSVIIGKETIDIDKLEQVINHVQAKSIAFILYYIVKQGIIDNKYTIKEILHKISNKMEKGGLDLFSPFSHPIGQISYVRKFELGGALNRLRTLKIKQRR